MRNERKYKIISLLTTLLAILLLGNCAREYWRMESTVDRHEGEYVLKGAKVYAENCVQCHGPKGEGVVGMPLNREDLQVDFTSAAGKDIYNLVYQTVSQGRKGNDAHPLWKRAPDGKWISYSTMPSWAKEYGGPLDTDYVKAVTLFVMKPDGSQWDYVGDGELAPFQTADVKPDKDLGYLPLPPFALGSNADDPNQDATTASAKAMLRDLGKTGCLTCHAIGSKGGRIGPDLTRVGAWGLDQKFLEDWIKYANRPAADEPDQTPAMAHDQRMPVYWSSSRATAQPDVKLQEPVMPPDIYYMWRFKPRLTDQEISTLAQYLMTLK